MKLSTQLIITTLSKSTHSISIFVLSIILSRYFTKDEYGTYLHVQLIVNFAVWAFLLGLPHSVYYFLPRVANQRKFVTTTVLLVGVISIITAFLILFNVDFLSELLSNPNLEKLGGILFCLVLFQVPLTLFEPLMISAKKVQSFSVVELFFNVSFFLTVCIAVLFDTAMIDILLYLSVLFSLHVSIVIFYEIQIAISFKREQPKGDEYSIYKQFDYSLPIGLSMGVAEVSRYTDKVIVSNRTTPEDFAVYTRGAMEIPIISMLANTLDNLLMPKFVEAYKNNDTQSILHSWHSVIRMMATFIYPCCFFLICTASLLIPALFSEKYIGSVIIFQIYTLGLLTRISTFNVIIRAIGKTKAILWISLLSIVFNIGLTLLFMDWWGIIGAPIATVVTISLMRYVYLLAITHYLEIKVSEVFPWTALLHSLLSSAIASVPVILLLPLGINVWLLLFLMGVIYGVLYLMFLNINSALKPEEKDTIRGMLPNKLRWVI